MIRKQLLSGVLASICLFAFSLPSMAQRGNSCTARGIFSSCSANCPAGQTPVCKTGFLGTSVSCTCAGSSYPTELLVDKAQLIAFDGYARLLSSFSSSEAQVALETAIKMSDAALKDDVPTYIEAAVSHEDSLKKLPSEELDQVYEYLKEPKP